MNFLNKRNSAVAAACLVLFQLGCSYSSPVRSPRTSALKLRNILANIQRVPRSDQDYHLIPNDENGADVAVTPGQSFLPTTAEGVPLDEPEAIDNTGPNGNYPDSPEVATVSDETELPALPTDVDSGLRNSDAVETVTSSNVQEPIQKLEDPSYSKFLPEQELPTTSELYHSPTAEAHSNPAELPLTYPIVRVPEGPSAIPITVADLPLETILPPTAGLPEKEEISSSLPEAPDQSSIIAQQGNNVGALPLELDAKTQTASSSFGVDPSKYQPNNSYDLITTDNPNEKVSNSSGRPIGSRLRELGFPPISNTQDNFGVQVNWAEFR
ncbi:hypothetical protein DAPPUDRAFT_308983 [Daphnia pulex]|uniref:DUF4794 domain-containing protein n=1 Tax=Daphnia pulex TaxID=6669 RepID=E9G3D1_DAPPU|nr:hypothetical protein DAPPUDRAFT_308983 [Daphnia pulex]|eukprot:EFX85751.1 hypothetical protein DAPPUDRAFT_308983 [Daphnia pulex]